jgi:hypothetical protein
LQILEGLTYIASGLHLRDHQDDLATEKEKKTNQSTYWSWFSHIFLSKFLEEEDSSC